MNASDIVKSKQNRTLHVAYYHPTVLEFTVYSTVNAVSSILNYVSSSYMFTSTSYTSTLHTVNTRVCNPTFISYEMEQHVLSGNPVSELQWTPVNSTIIYAYSTVYSSLIDPNTILPSTVRLSSTTVTTGPGPVIYPLVTFYQGPNR